MSAKRNKSMIALAACAVSLMAAAPAPAAKKVDLRVAERAAAGAIAPQSSENVQCVRWAGTKALCVVALESPAGQDCRAAVEVRQTRYGVRSRVLQPGICFPASA